MDTLFAVEATVFDVIHEFNVAYARDASGLQHAILPGTPDAIWHERREGQSVRLDVSTPPALGWHAEVVQP